MTYGIYDTQDDSWLGDDKGPKLFTEAEHGADAHLLARAAAQVAETQLTGSDLGGRIVAKEYDRQATLLKDSVGTRMSAAEALLRMGVM